MNTKVTTRYFTLLLVTALLYSGCGKLTSPTDKFAHLPGQDYNVVVILIDTLRPDHLGCYGYNKPTSPHIDALAQDSVVFENAYTASTFTGEAVSSLFTGRPPAMNATGLGWTARPTPKDENLPKRYEAAGFKTGIFSTSFVMRFRGFYDSFEEAELFPAVANTTALDDELTDAALAFAARHHDTPTFSYLHYYAPHAPYHPPEASLAPFGPDYDVLTPSDELSPSAMVSSGMTLMDPKLAELRKHYDGEIAFIDASVGRYLDGLRQMGQLEKTIVVLVSDHGEEFMEHHFVDHAWNLYEETLRIPMIVYAPGMLAPQRIRDRVSIYDIMPTLLRMSHLPHTPFTDTVSGQYLVAAGDSAWEYAPRSGPLFASLFPESRAQLHAVLFDEYKYIAGPRWLDAKDCKKFWLLQGRMAREAKGESFLPLDPWAPPANEVLFNLGNDPDERKSLIQSDLETAEKGRDLIQDYRDASAPYRLESGSVTTTDPFDEGFVEKALSELSNEATPADQDPGVHDHRISPEVLESLETMGYL